MGNAGCPRFLGSVVPVSGSAPAMQCDGWEGHSAGCVLRIRLIQPPLRELQGLLHGAGGLEPTHSNYILLIQAPGNTPIWPLWVEA